MIHIKIPIDKHFITLDGREKYDCEINNNYNNIFNQSNRLIILHYLIYRKD